MLFIAGATAPRHPPQPSQLFPHTGSKKLVCKGPKAKIISLAHQCATQDGKEDLDLDPLHDGSIAITAEHFGQTLPPLISLSHTFTLLKIPLKLAKCPLTEVRNGHIIWALCDLLEIM